MLVPRRRGPVRPALFSNAAFPFQYRRPQPGNCANTRTSSSRIRLIRRAADVARRDGSTKELFMRDVSFWFLFIASNWPVAVAAAVLGIVFLLLGWRMWRRSRRQGLA